MALTLEKNFLENIQETSELVSSLSDKDIWRLNRGGHDPHKVFAAYDKASKNVGSPTVVIAKTIKGYGMGKRWRKCKHYSSNKEVRYR